MRVTAVKELRPFPGSETDATLMRVLKDPEVDVRRAAGWVLKDIARPESVPALIHALTDEDDHVRRSIAEALGKLGDRRAVDPLIRVLPHALPEAATALATLGEEARVKTILKTLCDPASKLEGCLLLSDSLRPSRP